MTGSILGLLRKRQHQLPSSSSSSTVVQALVHNTSALKHIHTYNTPSQEHARSAKLMCGFSRPLFQPRSKHTPHRGHGTQDGINQEVLRCSSTNWGAAAPPPTFGELPTLFQRTRTPSPQAFSVAEERLHTPGLPPSSLTATADSSCTAASGWQLKPSQQVDDCAVPSLLTKQASPCSRTAEWVMQLQDKAVRLVWLPSQGIKP